MFANLLLALGAGLAQASSSACAMWFLDEPECPKSLLK